MAKTFKFQDPTYLRDLLIKNKKEENFFKFVNF